MSKFRELAEDTLNTITQPKYQYLTSELQNAILDWVYNNIEIDPSELSSASWDDNPYDVEPQLKGGSGTWVYDDEEMENAQLEKAIEYIQADGIENYLPEEILPKGIFEPDFDEEISIKLNQEAIDYLTKQQRN